MHGRLALLTGRNQRCFSYSLCSRQVSLRCLSANSIGISAYPPVDGRADIHWPQVESQSLRVLNWSSSCTWASSSHVNSFTRVGKVYFVGACRSQQIRDASMYRDIGAVSALAKCVFTQGRTCRFGQLTVSDIRGFVDVTEQLLLSGSDSGNLLLWEVRLRASQQDGVATTPV